VNRYTRNGLIIGALIGCWGAWTNWEGNLVRAVATVVGGAIAGFVIGHLIKKGGG
jgi:hypothetical protein